MESWCALRNILVTGGSRGIGLAIVKRLSAAGYTVVAVARNESEPLTLRLVAIKKPRKACAAARRKARKDAKRHGNTISRKTLAACDWVILVTSLDAQTFSTDDILDLYRLRWRIELGFKRLKSLVALRAPPGTDERSARPWLLAHILMILLLEPLTDELEDSPRWALAA